MSHPSKDAANHRSSLAHREAGFSHYVPRLLARLNPDTVIALLLFAAGLYAYVAALAPTVLEGDAALFQYTPYVLGVTYPTGYPLYILLGKLWVTLWPFGELAWRMNLLSALCSAAALPLIYGATRRLLNHKDTGPVSPGGWISRWGALATVLIFASLPTFWRWSTETKIYALNVLLFSSVLYTLALAVEMKPLPVRLCGSFGFPFRRALSYMIYVSPLACPALLLGLQLSVHSTTVLLIPGLLLLAWLHLRGNRLNTKNLFMALLLLILPGLLYLYIPLRAEWLIAHYGRQEAITRGLLADFYHSGLPGLVRYFTAADFTGGVVTNWGRVPRQFFTIYVPLLVDDMSRLGLVLGLIGGIGLAITRFRLFLPLFLIYAVPIPFVLTYGQGEQSAFLLPSFLIFSIFAGHALVLASRLLAGITRLYASPFTLHLSRFLPLLLFLALIPSLLLSQIHYDLNWLDAKWTRAIYNEWSDALAHPLPSGAAVLAHWGDLTSFWYMQYAEGRRPDLRGLYPPTEQIVADYLSRGDALFIAGPLQGWAAGVEERYQLLPWGRLVRIAPRRADPAGLLPPLPHTVEAVFDHKLRLVGVDYPPQAVDGQPYPVSLGWQALAELPRETTISVRLSQGETIVAQLDDTLLSGWFPRKTLPAGQFGLSYASIPIPAGTLPGQYRLQMVVYLSYKHPWPLADDSILLDLGEVELTLPPVRNRLLAEEGRPVHALPGHDFNGEIELVDYEYTANRVDQGKGFGVKLLWRALTSPEDNYLLRAEVIDATGQVLRSVDIQPVGGRTSTASWQTGQLVRDQVDLVLPASAPVGEKGVRVRLSWVRPDGSRLRVRRWLLPAGDSLDLDWIAVTEKEDRVFEIPQVQYPVGANLDNKARLIGYNSPLLQPSGTNGPMEIQFSRGNCTSEAIACQIHFDFYWQGLSEMDRLYFVFLHLIDEQGQIVAQHDLGPGKRGKEPTTSWLPGEVILDPVDLALPPDLLPGRYRLRIGMYLPPAGPRLPVLNEAGQAMGDFVEVGEVRVVP